MPSKFGGIPVDEEDGTAASKFGGVSIDTPRKQELAAEAQKRGLSLEGSLGALTRGAGPTAIGAAAGAGIGAIAGGVGAIPGAIAGAGAVELAQLAGDPIVGTINEYLGTNYTLPTQALENLFTKMGISEPKTEAERVLQTTASGASAAGGAAAIGKTIATGLTGTAREVGKKLAAQPAQQVAGGALAGAAGQAAQEADIGAAGQIAASLAGGVGGAAAAGTRLQRAAQHLPSDIAAAERAGIDIMTTDILPPRTFASKWLQSVGERIPLFGTGGVRRGQQEQRISSVKDLLLDFQADDALNASDEVMRDLATKRSSDLTRYSTAKNDIIDKLGEQGTEVPVTRTVSAIDNEINKLTSLNTEEVVPVIQRLDDWKSALQGQNISNVELLRRQIGESFKAPDLAGVRSTGEKSLSSIYGELRKDMGDFIKANGNRRDFDKWDIANKRLSGLANDLKMGALKSTLKSGDVTPEVVNKMLFSKKPSEIKKLYSKLTPDGRRHARSAIMIRAAEKAGGIENVSPDRFKNEVKRLGDSIGVFFSGGDLARVEGLAKALAMTERAAGAAVAPPTGVQVALPVGAAVLTDFMGSAGAATASGATVGLFARLYESPAVRNILVKFPKVKGGSPEEAALVKRFAAVLKQQSDLTEEAENNE